MKTPRVKSERNRGDLIVRRKGTIRNPRVALSMIQLAESFGEAANKVVTAFDNWISSMDAKDVFSELNNTLRQARNSEDFNTWAERVG